TMARPLLGKKPFVIHYGGNWETTIPGKVNSNDYKGGMQKYVKVDGDEFCLIDLKRDVQKLVGEGVGFQIASIIQGKKPTRAPVIPSTAAPIKSPTKIALPVKSSKNNGPPVKSSKPMSPAVKSPQKIPLPDFCTQNIHEYLDELEHASEGLNDAENAENMVYEYDNAELNGGLNGELNDGDKYKYDKTFGPVFGSWMDAGYDSIESESDDDKYSPTNSDYSDNDLDNDIDPMVVDEEVHNLEEELQGSVLANVMGLSRNIYEEEEGAKVADPVVEKFGLCELKPKMSWPTVDACREFFVTMAIKHRFSFRQVRNDKFRDDPEELVLPPKVANKVGRPRKQRIRGDDEPPKTRRKCTKCGEPAASRSPNAVAAATSKDQSSPGQKNIKKPNACKRRTSSRTKLKPGQQKAKSIKKPQCSSSNIKKPQYSSSSIKDQLKRITRRREYGMLILVFSDVRKMATEIWTSLALLHPDASVWDLICVVSWDMEWRVTGVAPIEGTTIEDNFIKSVTLSVIFLPGLMHAVENQSRQIHYISRIGWVYNYRMSSYV
ncbi:hypothetical protein IFM89_007191, partial [Coptis chinensis]